MSTIEQQATGTFVADTVHSHVGFEVPYAVATFSGEVTDFAASLVDGRLEGSAKIESITPQGREPQGHLLSPEFFDAERHPVLAFNGDLARDGDNGDGRRRDHDQGNHEARHARRHDRRPDRRSLRCDANRPEARDGHRPHRVRHEVEHATPERRARARATRSP